MKPFYLIIRKNLQWRFRFILFCLFAYSSICVATTPYGTNLVINGDANDGLTGWTASGANSNNFLVGKDPNNLPENVFKLSSGAGTLSQIIDISDFQNQITTGLIGVNLSGYAFFYSSYSASSVNLQVNTLNASGNIIEGNSFNNGILSGGVWNNTSLSLILNPSAMKLKISIIVSSNGSYVYFDHIQASLFTVPSVSTTSVTTFTTISATMGGNVITDNNSYVNEKGVVYSSTNSTPIIGGIDVIKNISVTGTSAGTFTSTITGLTSNTTYYVRAYATNRAGTSYGSEESFTTLPLAPTVSTQTVSDIKGTTATGNGNIINLGLPNPTAFGICWNTTGTPMTSDSKIDKGTATVIGAYTASITGLSPNTTYYARAYATNTAGTSYGNEVSFTTLAFDGAGSNLDPYQIVTASQLNDVRNYIGFGNEAVCFKLMNDIDLTSYLSSGSPGYNSGEFWLPIGNNTNMFEGKFDGNNHVIRGLKINRPTESNVGLFGNTYNSASIKNLGVEMNVGQTILVYGSSGVLVGDNRGEISGCYAKGAISGTNNFIGGIAGYCFGTVTNCYANVAVTGNTYVGGLVGAWEGSAMSNCYAIGKVQATTADISKYQGGLIGVDGSYQVNPPVNLSLVSNFWNTITTEQTTSIASDVSNGKTTAEMKTQNTFTGWDFAGETANGTNDIWMISTVYNNGYPFFKWQATIWTGATNTNWNTDSNWAASVKPTSVDDVVIAPVANQPVVSSAAVCKNLSLLPNANLTLTSATLAVGGNFALQGDATGIATFVDNGTLTVGGTSTVQQYLTGATLVSAPSGRFWYVASPVIGTKSGAFDAAGENKLWSYAEPDHGYSEITDNTTDLTVGVGYAARLGGNTTVTLTGTGFYTGEKIFSLARTDGNEKSGYNLIGNPYPSYLDWQSVTLPASVLPTVWTRSCSSSSGAMGFDTYNSSLSEGARGVSSIGNANVTQYIAPLQAFWVKVATGNTTATITVNNNLRSQNDLTVITNKLKIPAVQTQKVLRLQVSNDTNSDETVVAFNTTASNDFDKYDSPKMSNNNVVIPELYTLAGTEKLAINGMNNYTLNQPLPLGFATGTSGNFTIKATDIRNFDTNTKIILKDNILNVEQTLTVGATYTFSSDVTNNTNRFSIIFKSTNATTAIDEKDNQILFVYKNANNRITINCNPSQEGTIKVYNSIGQELINTSVTGTSTVINKEFAPGVYVVTINIAGNKTTKKVIVN